MTSSFTLACRGTKKIVGKDNDAQTNKTDSENAMELNEMKSLRGSLPWIVLFCLPHLSL